MLQTQPGEKHMRHNGIRTRCLTPPLCSEQHLPKLVHTLHHKNQIAVLSTVAARGLEYAKPWFKCTFDYQIATARTLSKDLLGDWSSDYQLNRGMSGPVDLLQAWLGFRLDPESGGHIHSFLAETCAIAPDEPSITFEGHWFPNSLAFACSTQGPANEIRSRMITGRCHGGLHGMNVIVSDPKLSAQNYWLIDLVFYKSQQFLFYDQAYFEITHLRSLRAEADAGDWYALLADLSRLGKLKGDHELHSDNIGLINISRAWWCCPRLSGHLG